MSAQELSKRLYRMFKGVPGFTEEEALELVEDAMQTHGYAPTDSVPIDRIRLVLLYAQLQGTWQIAFSVAHYFKFSDGEETVDKSMIADNYRKLAKDLQTEYDIENGKLFGNNFRIMPRVDRPRTTPPTGESGRYTWPRRRY